jgi:hypothetical protein
MMPQCNLCNSNEFLKKNISKRDFVIKGLTISLENDQFATTTSSGGQAENFVHCTYVYGCAFKKQSSFNQRIFLLNQTSVPRRSTIRAETVKYGDVPWKMRFSSGSRSDFFMMPDEDL